MKITLMFIVLLLPLWGCAPTPRIELSDLPGPRGELSVEVYGFRTLKGDVLLSLFREEIGFPEDTGLALVNLSQPVTSGRVRFELPPLPWGRYSYSILHDENNDGKMDQSLLGTPQEGYALSNGLEGHFGQPDAEAALFEIGPAPQHHELRIHYFKRKGQGPFGR